MGRSNRFADMNEVYVHTEIVCKEQLTIHLWDMGGGPNNFCRQPRPQFTVVEGKSNAKPWQYKEDQFQALEDQLETSPTHKPLCGAPNARMLALCAISCHSVGGRVQTRYTRILKLLATQRVHGGKKK
jgi:hypothetical protein